MPNTRELYNRCYSAWRQYATWKVQAVARNHRPIYRAAGDSFVMEASPFTGWIDRDRWLKFVTRRMDLQNAR